MNSNPKMYLFILGTFLFSGCGKSYVLEPVLIDVKAVTWEDKGRFNIEDLIIDKYHPEVKVLLSSALDLMPLSQAGMSIGAKAYINENGNQIELMSSPLFLENIIYSYANNKTVGLSDENRPTRYSVYAPFSIEGYLYSMYISIERPDRFRLSKPPFGSTPYNLLETNSDIFIHIGPVVNPLTYATLTSDVIRIPNTKFKKALRIIMPLKMTE